MMLLTQGMPLRMFSRSDNESKVNIYAVDSALTAPFSAQTSWLNLRFRGWMEETKKFMKMTENADKTKRIV